MRIWCLVPINMFQLYTKEQLKRTFEVITQPWDDLEKWPTGDPIEIEDGHGVHYFFMNYVLLKQCEAPELTTQISNLVSNCVTQWNATYPANQIPAGTKLIYTSEEMALLGDEGLRQLCKDEQSRLRENVKIR